MAEPGRPPGTYKLSNDTLQLAWDEYKTRCDNFTVQEISAGKVLTIVRPRVYTVEEFCDFAGIDDDTLNEYGKIDIFSATVKKIKKSIFARKQSALINSEGSTTGLIFDMKANYGINDKNLIDLTGEVTNKIIIQDAAGCEPITDIESKSDAGIPGE